MKKSLFLIILKQKFIDMKKLTVKEKLPGFIGLLALIFTLGAFMISCESKPPENSRATQITKGKAHFDQYCASCHSEGGAGPAADTLEVKPADLSQIISRRKSKEFPVMEIARYIDGRQFVAAHGTREMPIWGEVFAQQEELSETEIKGKLGELIAYLISIQE